jgi:hypothetical protein
MAKQHKEGTFSESEQNRQHLDTIRKLLKNAANRRVQAKPEYFNIIVAQLFPSLLLLWTNYSELVVSGKATTVQLTINSQLDAILIFALRVASPVSIQESADMKECIRRLLLKTEAFMKLLRLEEKSLHNSPDRLEAMEITATVLTFEFSYIQNLAPLAYGFILREYMTVIMNLSLAPWESLTVKKGCLLMLYRALKLQIQYDPKGYHLRGASAELQAEGVKAHGVYSSIFSRETLERLLSEILSKVMTIDEEGRESRLDLQLEEEEPDNIDQATNEMDCTLRKIGISIVEQLAICFPETLDLIHVLAKKMCAGELNVDMKTKDSIVNILSLLPHLYLRQGDDSGDRLDIRFVMEWLFKQASSMSFFSRRFCLLLRTWFELLPGDQMRAWVPQLCELLNHPDIVTVYAALVALKKIIKADREHHLSLEPILEKVMPAILKVSQLVTLPNLLWPALSILTNIMEQLHLQGGPAALDLLGNLDLAKLMERNDALVRSVLIDIFETTIISVPFGTPLPVIFDTAFRFLAITLPHIESEDTEQLVFWKFLVKEFPSQPSMQSAKQKHFELLNAAIPSALKKLQEPLQVEFLVGLVHESLLLDSSMIKFE